MARVTIKQKAQNIYAGVKNTARSLVEPRVKSPVPYSVQNQGKLYAPAMSNITANIRSPRNLLSAVPTDVRTAVPKFINKINTNVNFLKQNPEARQYAPSTAGDFIRGDYGLSRKSKSPLVQGIRENVGDLAQQNLSGFMMAGQGVGNLGKKGALNRLQGLSQVVGGLGTSYLSATPLGVGTTILSNTPRMGRVDPVRRLSSGVQSAFAPGERLDTNAPSQEMQVGSYRVDPLKAVGAMTGYILRPENRKFFQMTEKLLPGSSKSLAAWGAITGTRGGIEGLFSGLQTLPTGLSSKEKVAYMTKQGLYGVASELLVRGAFKGAGAGGNRLLKTDTAGSGLVGLREGSKSIPSQRVNKYLVKIFNDLLGVRDKLVKADFEGKTTMSPNGQRLLSTGEYAKQPALLADIQDVPPMTPVVGGGNFDRQTRLIDDPRTPGKKVAIYTDTNEPVLQNSITKRAQRDSIGMENVPGYTPPRSYFKRDATFGLVGAQAGWERDEEGNLRYNPTKGIAGAYVGVNASRGLTGRKLKIGLSTEEITAEGRKSLQKVQDADLMQEARKYKSAEEFVKGQNIDNKTFDVSDDFMMGKSVVDSRLPKGLKIQQSHIDSISGEQIMKLKVLDKNGKAVGTIDYGTYHGEPNIKMIEVSPEYRRKGIATTMMDKLQEMYPDKKIDLGMSTPNGTALLKNYDFNKTKSQLTDIYNQAQPKVGGDLATEARKYKSAEEFVGTLKTNEYTKTTSVPMDLDVKSLVPNEPLPKVVKNNKIITEPISVIYDVDKNIYRVPDGHNRLAQAIANGQKTIPTRTTFVKGGESNYLTKSQLTDIYNQATKQAPQPRVKVNERGFVTNVKGSEVAMPETKAGLTGKSTIYDPITNKQTIQQTKFDLDTEGWDASKKRVIDEPLSAETNVLGQQLIKRAQDEGRFDEAIELVEQLSKKGTEAGQAVQAFSVWGKLTPEGMLKYAVNQVDTAKQQMGFATKTARQVFSAESPEIKPEDARIITDLMKKAQSATTEQEQADYARSALEYIGKKIPWGVSEIIDEYRYNNMLSGPLTHLRNLYSNVLQSGLVRPATLVAQGKPLEAIEYEKAVLKTIPDAFSKAIDVFKTGKKLQRLDDVMLAGANQFKPKRLGKLYNIPSSALEASDTFFTTLIKQGELARGATKEEAQKSAEYWVFRQGLNSQQQGALLNSIDNMTKGIYGLRKVGLGWVIPFLQTPMNVAKQGIEFSPAGVLTTIGAKNKGEQLAKAGVGSVVSLIGLSLAMQDRTTWDVPVDKSQRELFYASGKKPYSIKVGDKWVPMQYLGPFAWSVGLPAAYKHYQENSRTALTDSQLKKLMSATMSGAKFWSQQTFMQGLGQFVKLAEGDTDYDLPKIVSNFASQVNPMTSLQRYVAQVVDPVFRKAGGDTFMQKVTQQLQTGIPGQSKKLEAYTNPLGEESRRNASNYIAPWGMGQEDKRFTGALESRERTTQINAFVTGIENEYEPDIERVTTQLSKQIEGEVLSGLDLTDEQRLEAIKKIQSRVRSKVKKSVMTSRSKDIANSIRKSWGDTPEEKREFLKVMKDRGLLTADILDALLNG